MYVPQFNALDDLDEAIRAMVAAIGSAELVTAGEDGYPLATRLPVVWDGDRLVLHIARANPHWRRSRPTPTWRRWRSSPTPRPTCRPRWYATKAEHGRVVPTWNYSAVQITGRLRRHEDAEWLRAAVTMLTEQHESRRAEPWAVTDAPATYVDKQLRAIVGLELTHRAGRGQGQAEPEPVRGGPGRRRGRAARPRVRCARVGRRRADGAAQQP